MSTFILQYPIEFNGKTIEQLDIQRLKVKHVREVQVKLGENATDAEKEVLLLSIMTGLSIDEIGELDLTDYTGLQQYLKVE